MFIPTVYTRIFMNFMVKFAKNRLNLYKLNFIYYCFSSEKLNLYWFWQEVRETKIDFDRGSGGNTKHVLTGGPSRTNPPITRPTLPTIELGLNLLKNVKYFQHKIRKTSNFTFPDTSEIISRPCTIWMQTALKAILTLLPLFDLAR